MRKRILILLSSAVLVVVVAMHELSRAQSPGARTILLPANVVVHQPGSLPAYRRFLRETEQTKNDSLIRVAVFSTSRKSDSLTQCIVHGLRSLCSDPRQDMQVTWSNNWDILRTLRTNGIFNRPVGIFKDTSGNAAIQYREAWAKFRLQEYDRPWQFTIFEKNNPAASDFIFSRDTTVLSCIHQSYNYGWKEINYTSAGNTCALVIASEVSPEIGAIQPEPLYGISTWMLHTPDFTSKGAREETKQQLALLRPRLCIFSIDKNDRTGIEQARNLMRMLDPSIAVLVITTSQQSISIGTGRAAYLRVNEGPHNMTSILKDALTMKR